MSGPIHDLMDDMPDLERLLPIARMAENAIDELFMGTHVMPNDAIWVLAIVLSEWCALCEDHSARALAPDLGVQAEPLMAEIYKRAQILLPSAQSHIEYVRDCRAHLP